MLEKICLIVKKLLIFSAVYVASLFTLALILGLANVMGKSDTIDIVAVLSMMILPIVAGVVVVRNKYPKSKTDKHVTPQNVPASSDAKTHPRVNQAFNAQSAESAKEPKKAASVSSSAPVEKTYRVAGTSFYTENIMTLAYENPDYEKTKQEIIDDGMIDERIWKYGFYTPCADLVPEPDNPHDKNAIQVIVSGLLVGYIKAGSCAHLLKVIDGGRIRGVDCEIYGGPFKIVTEEYDSENEYEETYTLKQEDRNFSVILHVYEEPEKK